MWVVPVHPVRQRPSLQLDYRLRLSLDDILQLLGSVEALDPANIDGADPAQVYMQTHITLDVTDG